MGHHDVQTLTFRVGEVRLLPHTLSQIHHLSLELIEASVSESSVVFELHNPEAEPDTMVGGLVEANLEDVERANRWREKAHLPDKPIPVDTSTLAVVVVRGKLHEKLQIGDRAWTISAVAADGVTLTLGHDYETHTLINIAAELEYQPEAIALEGQLGAVDNAI